MNSNVCKRTSQGENNSVKKTLKYNENKLLEVKYIVKPDDCSGKLDAESAKLETVTVYYRAWKMCLDTSIA